MFIIYKHQADHYHLEGSLEFPPIAGRDHHIVIGSDEPEPADNKFPADNNDYDP